MRLALIGDLVGGRFHISYICAYVAIIDNLIHTGIRRHLKRRIEYVRLYQISDEFQYVFIYLLLFCFNQLSLDLCLKRKVGEG